MAEQLCNHCGVRPVAPSRTKPAKRCAECRAYFAEKNEGRPREMTCAQCGHKFIGTKVRKFCSHKCQAAERASRLAVMARGAKSHRWTGGRIIRRGYVVILDTDYENRKGGARYRAEHRIVMEGILGRPLRSWEIVHHRNGVKTDNRPENLELWVKGHPNGQHDAHCPSCTCFQTKTESELTG